MNHTVRKAAKAAAIASVIGIALAGCGGQSTAENTQSEAGPVKLRISWWGSNDRVTRTEKAIDAFEAANPNITVDTEYGDWGGYWDRLATQTAGDNAPDVMQMDIMYIAQFASQGMLYDLSQASDELDLSTMDEALASSGKYDGKQVAVPISSTTPGVIVNHDVLDKLGLTLPDTTTWTWQDYEDFAKQVTEKSNGEIVGSGDPGNAQGLYYWARQHGYNVFQDGKVAVPEDVVASYLQMVLDWSKNGVAGSAERQVESGSGSTEQTDFATGKQAMIITHATQVTAMSKALGTENLSLELLPTLDGKPGKANFVKPGQLWAVSAKSEHPKEAAKLVNYLVNDKGAGEILGTERGIPANNEIRETFAKEATGPQKTTMEFLTTVSPRLGDALEPEPNGASSIDKTMTRYMQDVLFEKITPADAAKAMLEELTNSIATAS